MYAIRVRSAMAAAATLLVISLTQPVSATAPKLGSLGRSQVINYSVQEEELLRIWVLYVGQGDGIFIQLPEKYSYDPNVNDGESSPEESIEILVDGGLSNSKMPDFIKSLYTDGNIQIEHAVLTHHDKDHVNGLTSVLKDKNLTIDRVYHNGLASYKPGQGFAPTHTPSEMAVYANKSKSTELSRFMGFVNQDGTIRQNNLLKSRQDLLDRHKVGEFVGVYDKFAGAVTSPGAQNEVAFSRAWVKHDRSEHSDFIMDVENDRLGKSNLDGLDIQLIWPISRPQRYGSSDAWGKTVNGHSVTFRLVYEDFSMLFTGDLNKESEPGLLKHLEDNDVLHLLKSDVLKMPHHGSRHNEEDFFKATEAIFGVASQGVNTYGHPSPDTVIKWLGGASRVYLTQFEETPRLTTDAMKKKSTRESLYEQGHVLIETDGVRFRIVEIPLEDDLLPPPTVGQTAPGNGTRWIKAK